MSSPPFQLVTDLVPACDQPAAEGGKPGKGGRKKRGRGTEAAPGAAPRRQFENKLDLLHVKLLRAEMMAAAKNLDFELAATIRDEVFRLEKLEMELL